MRKMMKNLCPDRYVEGVLDVKTEILKAEGIRGIIVDMDNTLIPYHSRRVDFRMIEWMRKMKEEGFQLCIVSNNTAEQGKKLARELDIPAIWSAVKPHPRSFRSALETMGLSPEETAVVGDQVFTDVLGGNRLGLHTILVVPLSSSEMPWTKIIRLVERKLLSFFQNQGHLQREEKGR